MPVPRVQDFFLYQYVDAPTRGDSILDLILSTEQNMFNDAVFVESLGSGDHKAIDFSSVSELNWARLTLWF